MLSQIKTSNPMKNHTEKKEAVIATFKAYRKNQIDKYELKAYLKDIEYQLYKAEFENTNQTDEDFERLETLGMWFKFFKGDTACTTIGDIINALDCPTNGKYILRNLDSAINDNELEIYFS